MSFEINQHPDIQHWNRQTYSILDFVGDIGGLKDGLVLLGVIIIGKLSSFNLKAMLTSELFYLRDDDAGCYS